MSSSANFGPRTVWLGKEKLSTIPKLLDEIDLQVLTVENTVTGCSSGLGKSLAQAIYNAGHRIVATARDIASLSYLPDSPTVLKIKLDVTNQEDISRAFNKVLDSFHDINVVINNAGYGLMGDMEAISDSDARHQVETNFWGSIHMTREAIRVFREVNPKGQGGTIVQVSSVGGFLTAPGHSFYHARFVTPQDAK